MSLRIEMTEITAVLLTEGWYPVDPPEDGYTSFYIDAYEYGVDMGDDFDIAYSGGDKKIVPMAGFAFKNKGVWYKGPLSAIQAVRMKNKEDDTAT